MCRPVVFHADLGDAVALMAPPVASKLNFRYPVNPPFPKPANAAALPEPAGGARAELSSAPAPDL